jgi:5-methylthioadenosine/S-adenosylhomocysteine deaminase
LRAATLAGARAIGLGDRIGSLEPGKQADFICVAMDQLETQPLYNAISQLVYSSGRSQVTDAWIAGEPRLASGELVDFDSVGLLERVRRWRDTIAAVRSSR